MTPEQARLIDLCSYNPDALIRVFDKHIEKQQEKEAIQRHGSRKGEEGQIARQRKTKFYEYLKGTIQAIRKDGVDAVFGTEASRERFFKNFDWVVNNRDEKLKSSIGSDLADAMGFYGPLKNSLLSKAVANAAKTTIQEASHLSGDSKTDEERGVKRKEKSFIQRVKSVKKTVHFDEGSLSQSEKSADIPRREFKVYKDSAKQNEHFSALVSSRNFKSEDPPSVDMNDPSEMDGKARQAYAKEEAPDVQDKAGRPVASEVDVDALIDKQAAMKAQLRQAKAAAANAEEINAPSDGEDDGYRPEGPS